MTIITVAIDFVFVLVCRAILWLTKMVSSRVYSMISKTVYPHSLKLLNLTNDSAIAVVFVVVKHNYDIV